MEWVWVGNSEKFKMTQTSHTIGREHLKAFDALGERLAQNTKQSDYLDIELERITHALQAANIFNKSGDFPGEASAYLLVIGILLALKKRNVSLPDNKPCVKSIIDYSSSAYNALEASGSLRFKVTGTGRIVRWLSAAYTLANDGKTKARLGKALEDYSVRLAAHKALLYRLEDDGFTCLKESAKLKVYAGHTTDASLKNNTIKTSEKLLVIAEEIFSMTGNYAVMNEIVEKTEPVQPELIHCPKCHTQAQSGDFFCAGCGFDLRTVTRICPFCSSVLQPDDEFCPNCGRRSTT